MSVVLSRLKALHLLLAAALLLECLPVAYLAAQDEKTAVDNVRFEVAGDLIRVFYDLTGSIDKVHAVRLLLRRESDVMFLYRPLNLSGDVGTIVFPGQRRRIVWEFTKEFPEGLAGDDYYFVVEAEYTEPESTFPWLWVGGGAAVVGTVVVLLLIPKKTETPPIPPANTFPVPVGRPN